MVEKEAVTPKEFYFHKGNISLEVTPFTRYYA